VQVSVNKARSILQFWQRKVEVASMLSQMKDGPNENHVTGVRSSTWTIGVPRKVVKDTNPTP